MTLTRKELSPMSSLLKTKTFWTGFLGILGGVAMYCTGDTDTGAQMILTGLSAICLRNAIAKQ
jgi:hypothetical protein